MGAMTKGKKGGRKGEVRVMFGDVRILERTMMENKGCIWDTAHIVHSTKYTVYCTIHGTRYTAHLAVCCAVHSTCRTIQNTQYTVRFISSLLSLPPRCPLTCIADSSSSSKDTGRGIFLGKTAMYAAHSDFLPMLFSRIKKSGSRSSSLRTER